MPRKFDLGKELVAAGFITEDQLQYALELQNSQYIPKRFEEILVEEGLVEEKIILEILARQLGLEVIDLYDYKVNPNLIKQFPLDLLRSSHTIPLWQDQNGLHIATSNPFAYDTLDTIERLSGRQTLILHLASQKEIDRLFQHLEIQRELHNLTLAVKKEMNGVHNLGGKDEKHNESAALQLIRLIIRDAIFRNASDIHIEPDAHEALVRCRIDGILHETYNFDLDIYQALASRIKILGNLDISERRHPQDGRFSLAINEHLYDFRLSTSPTLFGESIVMRILDRQKILLRLRELGFSSEEQEAFENAIHQPYGMILITGPTGSGKTTTLYAALNEIKSIENKVMTIEDPIEYRLPLIQQSQVNEKGGYTFAEAIRSFLRQDPDIIMLGEIRDIETLNTAAQAALTGHLVFSTMHTNDAPGTINRMLQMGLESYLVSDVLVAIVAQRLVRKICPYCKEEYRLHKQLPKSLSHLIPLGTKLYRGKGCAHCERSGYLGRCVVAEILLIDEHISEAISKLESKTQIANKAQELKLYRPMIYDGAQKVIQGVTSIDELLRITRR